MLRHVFEDLSTEGIARKPLPQPRGIGGYDDFRKVENLQVGFGTRAFKVDSSGIWLGAHAFADAPFRVNPSGDLSASSVTITGGSITGITDLAIADGGTGASSAADARTNLGLVVGTDLQAWDANLDQIAALAPTDNNFIVGNGSAWALETPSDVRTSLGLVAGGAGDIWVEKAGDIMSGDLEINANLGIGVAPTNQLNLNAPATADATADAIFTASATTQTPLVIQGISSQSANLQEWQDSSGNIFSHVLAGGELVQYMQIVAKTGAYTATTDDCVITCDASGGAFIVTLPAASGNAGLNFFIKKTDSSGNTVTVDGNASETIDGDTTKVISTQYDTMMIVCDGSNWQII